MIMGYIFYNPNPAGKSVGDCVIRGIAKLTGEDWETVYLKIIMQGFADYDMPSSNAVWGYYLRRIGYTRRTLPDTCPDCYTVRDFCVEHRQGQYLLATGSHVVAVADGNYYDAWDSGSEVPVYYWEREDD